VESSEYLERGLVTHPDRTKEKPAFALANRIEFVYEEQRDTTEKHTLRPRYDWIDAFREY